MITLSTEHFSYDARTETFTADMSDLGPGTEMDIDNSYIPTTHIRGFGLKSHITGSEISFKRMRDKFDEESGELQHLTYQSLMMTKSGGHYKLLIFND